MTKTTQEFEDLYQYIENEIVFYIDYFKSNKNKISKGIELHNIAKYLVEKVEDSQVSKEQKAELAKLIYSRLENPETL